MEARPCRARPGQVWRATCDGDLMESVGKFGSELSGEENKLLSACYEFVGCCAATPSVRPSSTSARRRRRARLVAARWSQRLSCVLRSCVLEPRRRPDRLALSDLLFDTTTPCSIHDDRVAASPLVLDKLVPSLVLAAAASDDVLVKRVRAEMAALVEELKAAECTTRLVQLQVDSLVTKRARLMEQLSSALSVGGRDQLQLPSAALESNVVVAEKGCDVLGGRGDERRQVPVALESPEDPHVMTSRQLQLPSMALVIGDVGGREFSGGRGDEQQQASVALESLGDLHVEARYQVQLPRKSFTVDEQAHSFIVRRYTDLPNDVSDMHDLSPGIVEQSRRQMGEVATLIRSLIAKRPQATGLERFEEFLTLSCEEEEEDVMSAIPCGVEALWAFGFDVVLA